MIFLNFDILAVWDISWEYW